MGVATELTNENCNDYDFWYNVICRVYRVDGALYGKLLVVSAGERSDLAGRLFVARGSMAYAY